MIQDLLKKYFGYDEFRLTQREIIQNVLDKKDTLVLMPTGGGKSLCYQIPALALPGVTLVISPLISLMKDQVDALRLNGIEAEFLNSTLSKQEVMEIEQKLFEQKIDLLYIAPERLALKSFRELLLKLKINLVAIDEAHCISEWGHDFRPDYKRLKYIKSLTKESPLIALTATATPKVKKDILKQLNLESPVIFQSSFERENLTISVREKKNSLAQILALLEKNKGESAIIYCHSRDETKNLSEELNHYGFKSIIYHAGLSDKIREKNQELFLQDKVQIIVATIAFGMGIDKSNVRLVIHNTFSKSLENYYQEIGRAGRDGLPSQCILFYSLKDKKRHEFFLDRITHSSLRRETHAKLLEIVEYCTRQICRKKTILKYFGEEYTKDNCGNCDVCLGLSKPINEKLPLKISTYNSDLLKELKELRLKLSQELTIIPTHIFSDVSLKVMAQQLPKNEKEFLKIEGVIQEKLKQFGEDFLMLINEHVMLHEISSKIVKKKVTLLEEDIKHKTKTKKKYYKKKKTSYKK